MQSFSELLRQYIERSGIPDTELARSVGVRRQTIFRWKEGLVSRPRHRDDVLALARKLRLNAAERDKLLIAAGFHPEGPAPVETAASEPADAPSHAAMPDDAERPAVPAISVEQTVRAAPRWRRRWLAAAGLALALIAVVIWWRFIRVSFPVAVEGETLLLVAEFANFAGEEIGFNVAGRLIEVLRTEVAAAELAGVRVASWPRPIRSEEAAREALTRAGGEMIVWGEYDSGRVVARLTAADDDPEHSAELESLVASPAELSATINTALPQEVRYLALVTLGQLYADTGHFDEARSVLLRAWVHPPGEGDARAALLFRLGYVHQLTDPPFLSDAIDFYTKLIAESPRHKSALYNRGLSYLERRQAGDLDRAIDDFTRSLRLDPDYVPALINRGVAYFYRGQDGDADAATADFTRAIQLDPDQYRPYYNRGLLHIRLDERNVWEADLVQTTELAPTFGDGFAALCWGYVLDREPANALPACDRALELGSSLAYNSRGMVYVLLGDYAQATEDFRAFLAWLDQQPTDSPYQRYRPWVNEWLVALAANENPLTDEVLARLRVE